jgi:hypothetical protein
MADQRRAMTNEEVLRERVAKVGGVAEIRIKHRRPRGTNKPGANPSRAILLYRVPNLRKIAE